MFTIRSMKKGEFNFLTDMLYESIHIPENKPQKTELLNATHLRKYHEGWGRAGDVAFIALDENDIAVGAVW